MPRRSRVFALLLTAAAAVPAASLRAADTYTIDKAHSDASFRIRHFATKVRGRFSQFEGAIQADPAQPSLSTVAFTIKSASIDTNNPDRDKHLQSPDFFDASKCPDITFTSSKITPAGKDKYEVAGTLTMRCVAKPVTIPVTFLGFAKDPGGNERASFEVVTRLNRKDFGINWNKTLDAGGVMLSDDVDVEINLETVKKKPEAAPAR
jgi:polyisoprenoid-binding protein YceI